jgi:flavodoxin
MQTKSYMEGKIIRMKIGIIVYSETGNTLFVAKKLKEKFEKEKYKVDIKAIEKLDNTIKDPNKIIIKDIPELDYYDILIFGSPVHGFTLAPAFKAYLKKLPSINEKIVCCYVTKSLPTKGFGGKKAIEIMKKSILLYGGIIQKTEIINWKKHELQIPNLIEKFSEML